MQGLSIKGVLRFILVGALAPLTMMVIFGIIMIYLYLRSSIEMNSAQSFDISHGHYGIFFLFGVQSLLYCLLAALFKKRGPIAGILLSTIVFIAWSIINNVGAPGDSAAGSAFNFLLLGAVFSFAAALISEYTAFLLAKIKIIDPNDPELDNLSYWRRRLKSMDKKKD